MILWFWWGRSSISNVSKRAILKSLQYLKKEVRDEVDSLHPDKLWVSKLSTRWSLLMDMIKHFQSTQSKDIYPYIISKKILSMVIILRLFVSEKKNLKDVVFIYFSICIHNISLDWIVFSFFVKNTVQHQKLQIFTLGSCIREVIFGSINYRLSLI